MPLDRTVRLGLLGVHGTCFTFVPMAISAANARSMALVSRFLKQARRIFPPIVTGLTAMLIGTRLIKAGIRNFGGGAAAGETFGSPQNLRLGSFVLTITILCNRFGTELLRIESVAVGLVPGYLVSIPLGQVDFAAVAQAGWVTVPRPLYFGLDFSWALLLPRILAYLITSIETSGDLADAAGSAAATLFNPMPNTTFNRNIGVISITKMGSRVVGYVAAGILLLLEFVPKIGALVIVTPNAVLGGATLALFAMVAISGIKIIAKDGLIDRKLFIMSIALNFGLAINYRPDIVDHMPPLLATVLSLGIAVGALLAIFLNLILPGRTAPTDA